MTDSFITDFGNTAVRPRLLVLSPSAEKYGSDRALLYALPELVDAYDVTIAFAAGGPLVAEVEQLGAQAVVLPDFAIRRAMLGPFRMWSWFARAGSAIRRLHSLHRSERFDAVYSNTLAVFIGPLLARRWRVPHVVHAHECPLEPRWLTAMLLRMLRGCSRIICNSDYTRRLIVEFEPGLARAAVVVHNGIDFPDRSGPGPCHDADQPLRITCVARIHRKKGHQVLLEAMALSVAAGRDWRLHCYGDALPEHRDLDRRLRELANARNIDDRVTWHGFVEGWERYDDADVAVVPSVYPEEFSLVSAEAHAMGLPVVATGPGGASEVLDDGVTGFIVPPRDARALFSALARIDDDRERAATMGVAGRRRVHALFSRETYARSIVARIDDILPPPDWSDRQLPTDRKPRMLIVAPSAELYGSDRSLLYLLPELTEAFDITIAYAGDGPAAEIARGAGVEVLVLPDFAFRRSSMKVSELGPWFGRRHRALRTLDEVHRRLPFDVVYSNTLAAGLGHTLRRKWRAAGAVHIRECPPDPRWQLRLLLAMVARTNELVICNSHYTRNVVLQHAPVLASRTTVVHNGIPLPQREPGANTGRSGPLRISCVGRIHPKKGQGVLIEAARIARDHGREWELHFFGDALPQHASLQDELRRAATAGGLDSQVFWHGFVRSNVRYEDVDVAVVPSVYPEEFSLVCVEAQSMELPVVATGPGGPSEIIVDGTTGFIVPPNDAEALYQALAALDDDPHRAAEMGRLGRLRMHERFSREVYASRVRDKLLGLLVRQPSRSLAA
jgi:glycosyltransferase involved in cell wall biosynthesis